MVFKFSKTGHYHTCIGEHNQDSIYCVENKRFGVIALADGISSCKKARAGAETAARAIAELFFSKGDVIMSLEKKQISELTIAHIRHELKKQTIGENNNIEDYSSTVSCVVFDGKTGKLMCFNVGDSAVFANDNGKVAVISSPLCGVYGCCSTTTKNTEAVADIKILDANGFSSVMICSDGAWKEATEKNKIKQELLNAVAFGEYDKFKEYLEKKNCFDDCSFVVSDFGLQRRKPCLKEVV